MTTLIDGKAHAAALQDQLAGRILELKATTHTTPGLAVVLVGDHPASQIYVRRKSQQTQRVGMRSFEHRLADTTSQGTLLDLIHRLNVDPDVHGILVQLPLPAAIDPQAVIEAIDPAKDVDGFHPLNVGALALGRPSFVPCTPLGCLMLLRHTLDDDLQGRHAVVLGRSNIVGKPMAALLTQRDCTVTLAHSKSRDLPALCRQADILVAAVGRPRLVTAQWVKPEVVVIDVGINRIAQGPGGLVGDVDFAAVRAKAAAITPVPGGVGPMTIACLLHNTVTAFCRRHGLDLGDAPLL
ncbi:MAG: bifunctional methylenetetrahydrofolate dehydrogenase/methenyltetrahydrofolate cyclohydrolase FolD [Candidatus Competibacterales bacterium]